MIPITVFLLGPDVLRIAFRYDVATKDALKALGAVPVFEAKKFLYWTLPLAALDKLIKVFGDDLAVDAEVFMAANPKTPAMVRAENDLWAERQGVAVPAQEGANLGRGGATGVGGNPGKCPACGVAWVYRDGTGWEPGCRCSCVAGPGTVRYDPVPLVDASKTTKYDEMLLANLPAWQVAAAKKAAMRQKGRKWTR